MVVLFMTEAVGGCKWGLFIGVWRIGANQQRRRKSGIGARSMAVLPAPLAQEELHDPLGSLRDRLCWP